MQTGFHHFLKRKKTDNQQNIEGDDAKKIMDRLIYVVTPFTVLIFVPQLLKIWVDKSVAGVSLVSWAGMLVASFFWLIYGIVHKEKPIIFINLVVGTIQFLIVLGILMYR